MKNLMLIVFLFYAGTVVAQNDSGAVVIDKDPRIDLLVQKQVQINEETTRDSRRSMPGFRIQVINSSDRNKVFSVKGKIYQEYPELKLYVLYQPPNYRLRAGNFKSSEEAEVYLKKLSAMFPTGLYVVHDVIEVKPTGETE